MSPTITLLAETPLACHTDRTQVACPEDLAGIIVPLMRGLDREICLVVSVDTKHRILAVDTISVGTVDHTFMAPREVFRTALARGAAAIFVAHNHPSGDPTPSVDDRQLSCRLAQAGRTLGIDLLDSLVVGDESWVSLTRLGVL